jgi:hypothetical protein
MEPPGAIEESGRSAQRGRPPLARSAITMASVNSVAMTMPAIHFRCVAPIEAAVEEFDLGIFDVAQTGYRS